MTEWFDNRPLPQWERQPDWQAVLSLEPGSVLTYADDGKRISVLVMGQERSNLFPGELLPRVEVEIRDADGELTDEAWGLLLGITLTGVGNPFERAVPPSDTAYRPLALEQDNHEGVLIIPAAEYPPEV